MPDGRRRSREGWADAMEAGPPAAPAHVHRLPKAVRIALVGLSGALFLCLVGLGLMAVYVYQANQYVQGRGEYRDAEAARMDELSQERIRRAMCDLLDTLPQGGLLDRPRAKYGCGPGIPYDELTPDEQSRIRSNATPPQPGDTRPTPEPPASPEPPAAAPEPAPAAPEPSPAPGPPLLDLGPITDLLCDSALICA